MALNSFFFFQIALLNKSFQLQETGNLSYDDFTSNADGTCTPLQFNITVMVFCAIRKILNVFVTFSKRLCATEAKIMTGIRNKMTL